MASFSELFKKYRLRSEFETLGDFAQEMQDRGLQYEESIYSHWQRGTRIPRDRNLLLIIARIFIEHGGISTVKDINTLLETAGQGYLTNKEIRSLPKQLLPQGPFLAPREIQFFTGREVFLQRAKDNLQKGVSILISGSAGMGKSSCAIKLAHSLVDEFPDGILWYRLDTSTAELTLNSIALTYGEDISHIQDIQTKSSFVRSLLSNKRALLVFDNLEREFTLELLLPASKTNVVIVTSRYEDLASKFSLVSLVLTSFRPEETDLLQRNILGSEYVQKNLSSLNALTNYLGHLPLAINLVSQELCKPYQEPKKLLKCLRLEKNKFKKFRYENRDLLSSLNLVFNSLPINSKRLFISLGVFAGTDFSLGAVAVINKVTEQEAETLLIGLVDSSLIEYSCKNRFRLHPIIRLFAQSKMRDLTIYRKVAEYYYKFIEKRRLKTSYFQLLSIETVNITNIFRKCIKLNYCQNVRMLWTDFFYFLWDTGKWIIAEDLVRLTYKFASKHNFYYLKAICCIEGFGWIYYWTGRVKLAEKYSREALNIGNNNNDRFIIAYAKQRLGRTLQGRQKYMESMSLLKESLYYFKTIKDYRRIGNTYRYLAETYSFKGNFKKAKNCLANACICISKLKKEFVVTEMYQNLVYAHLGALSLLENNIHLAEAHFKNGIRIDRIAGSKTNALVWNYIGLGLVYDRLLKKSLTAKYLNQAKKLINSLGLGKSWKSKSVIFSILQNGPENSIKSNSFRFLSQMT